jgi:hypothetical protein
MRILSISEQEAFDKPPLFDHEQRKQFFSFPNALLNIARGLRTPTGQKHPSTGVLGTSWLDVLGDEPKTRKSSEVSTVPFGFLETSPL